MQMSAVECRLPTADRQYSAHDETKHVYFSFFSPVKVTDELEIESLGWVHGGELAMGRNRYKPQGLPEMK